MDTQNDKMRDVYNPLTASASRVMCWGRLHFRHNYTVGFDRHVVHSYSGCNPFILRT